MRQTIIRGIFLNIFIFFTIITISGQNSSLEGYVFENENRAALNGVAITITEQGTNKFIANTTTNENGTFTAFLPVDKIYRIQANKALYLPQQVILIVKNADKGKKIFSKINLFRALDYQLSSPEIINAVTEYGIDTKKIKPTVNPDGVPLTNLVEGNDIYAEITNATRLVDENYEENASKELKKLQPMPTNFQSPVRIDPSIPNSGPKINQDLPNPYDQKVVDKAIIPEPKFGETMVAAAQNNPRTRTLPANYTGYKIEFFTTLSALPATHKIFNRHGNIVLERKSNGLFSYLLGDFVDKKLAKTFLQESLLSRYPTATLVSYQNGQRIESKKSIKAKTKPVSAPPR